MIPDDVADLPIHMTGIKGTGMAALAEILSAEGAVLTGSDVAERFFTDDLLAAIGVVPSIGFDAAHIPRDAAVLVYSSAYPADNPERAEASRRGIPQYSYTEMLGALSRNRRSLAVSGVHGKTSTTAMIGSMVRESDLRATVVVGSAVPSFGGSATLRRGRELFIAETCEYRRHFLDYSPDVLLVSSVEADHLDYYRDADDVADAFVEFGDRLPDGGTLIYCADDPGAGRVAARLTAARPDLVMVPYGFSVSGDGHVAEPTVSAGAQSCAVQWDGRLHPFSLSIPGRHMALNAAAAIVSIALLTGSPVTEAMIAGLSAFRGTRRRSEIIAEVGGVRIIDDYAHHPTAIRTTLAGFRAFWPGRRIVVDFMSHTFSRTRALLAEFATAFEAADILFLNDIYASAREQNVDGLTGRDLADAVARNHPDVRYVPDFGAAARDIAGALRPGDIFVTMGAGDNFRIGTDVATRLGSSSEEYR